MENEKTSLREWGLYIALVASVLIWVLKAIYDGNKKARCAEPDRKALMTRALWSFSPSLPGVPHSDHKLAVCSHTNYKSSIQAKGRGSS